MDIFRNYFSLPDFVCVILANQKAGFFVNEIWSYGLANSNYHPFLYSDGALEHGCTSAVVLYCSSYDLFMFFRKF